MIDDESTLDFFPRVESVSVHRVERRGKEWHVLRGSLTIWIGKADDTGQRRAIDYRDWIEKRGVQT